MIPGNITVTPSFHNHPPIFYHHHVPPFQPQTATTTPTSLPIKKLSPTQLQERRVTGLCYNCDEKIFLGHKCITKRFLFLLNEEPTLEAHPDTFPAFDTVSNTEDPNPVHLSLQALSGTPSAYTFKLQGFIHHTLITILIDTGCSHNILQPRLAHHLNL